MKKLLLAVVSLTLIMLAVGSVKATTGTIRISPALPVMVGSPATFEIWVQGAGDPTCDLHILLVMTNECFTGLTDDVVVTWDGGSTSFSAGDFVEATGKYVPPDGTTTGARYTVASLKDHIGTDGSIYWAMGSFLSGPLHTSPKQTFNVTLPSTSPRMLVYALGKTCDSSLLRPSEDLFNRRVPPTIPGFVVPELGTLLMALAPLCAFATYIIKKRS